MHIVEIELTNIWGIADGARVLSPPGANDRAGVTLVTGPTGMETTRFLQAIIAAKEGVGAWGSTAGFAALKRPGTGHATISVRWRFTAEECEAGRAFPAELTTKTIIADDAVTAPEAPLGLRRFFRSHDEAGLARFGYLHAERQWPLASTHAALPFAALAEDNRKFCHVLPRAVELLAEDQADAARAATEGALSLPGIRSRLTDLREALRPFLPRHALTSFSARKGEEGLEFATAEGARQGSAELAVAERHALLLALDALMNYRTGGGRLVLLDEPELHQHPDRQDALFGAYCALLRNTQVVAATTSPVLLASGAPVIRVDRSGS